MSEDMGVEISMTALSKSFRMFSRHELRDIIGRAQSGDAGPIFQNCHNSEKYHIMADGLCIVVLIDDGDAVVLTQMHKHFNHHKSDEFQQVHQIK